MKTLLFNPFEKYTEKQLIGTGILFTLLGSLQGYWVNARFDGVLDLHFVDQSKWWQALADNFVNVLCLVVFLFIASKIINAKTRLVDLLAVSLVARIPYFLLLFFNINNFIAQKTTELINPETLQLQNFSIGVLFPLLVFSLSSILILIWYMVLLYNGYKVAAHAKGTKAGILFVAAIILAEIVSKILIIEFV